MAVVPNVQVNALFRPGRDRAFLIHWSRNGPANPVPRPGWRVVSAGSSGCGGRGDGRRDRARRTGRGWAVDARRETVLNWWARSRP
jgi:hypothetical protein